MKITVDQITESPRDIRFAEGLGELNRLAESDGSRDFRFPPVVDIALVYYRSGREILFHGELKALVDGCCGRCLKRYALPVEKKFDLILTPEPLPTKGKELSSDELGLSYYASKEIDLSPLIREQVLLALPMRPLCSEDCRGLCAGCGVNLNDESCICPAPVGDPRMAVFRTLKLDHQ
jgi:uncharacterized protein